MLSWAVVKKHGNSSCFNMNKFLLVIACALCIHCTSGTYLKQLTIEERIKEWKRQGLPHEISFRSENDVVTVNVLREPPSDQEFATELSSSKSSSIESNIQYYLFTRNNTSPVPFSKDIDSINAAGFDPKRKTKIVVHGFTCNIKCDIFQKIPPNLLKYADYNVIGVDWGKLAKFPFYVSARVNVPLVGQAIAGLVDFLVENHGMNITDVHAMGHSLGGHVVGNIGKHVQSGTLPRISGLDPAGPLFFSFDEDRLRPSDAEVVDVIHTCGGIAGYLGVLGKYDFYVERGQHPQPGCGLLDASCSHERSMILFAESILEPESFRATACRSTLRAELNDCVAKTNAPAAYMGFHLVAPEDATYSVETASSAPYALSYHNE